MYQFSYSAILEDSVVDARATERRALGHAAALLRTAADAAPKSSAEHAALAFTSQLWGLFVTSLTSGDNDLPAQLRADLISVGLGVLAEVARIDAGVSRDLAGLADICAIVRDGLA